MKKVGMLALMLALGSVSIGCDREAGNEPVKPAVPDQPVTPPAGGTADPAPPGGGTTDPAPPAGDGT